jgi:methionyl-tRNA formyltransferase
MRAIFFGTPTIAVPSLEALASIAEVCAVVCQPDRPAGRGLTLRAPPVKERALALGLEVVQPAKIRDAGFVDWVRRQVADVALVVAYGKIFGRELLEAPRAGCLNLHASILPRYRGAAPIQWAIVRGERETGISLMRMDEGCDTGPVFSRHVIPIGEDETAGELGERLATLAAEVTRRDLLRAVAGELTAEPQDDASATHAPLIDKRDGLVDFSLSARAVHDHARGMTPWPGAFSFLTGKRFKLLETRVGELAPAQGQPGTVVRLASDAVEIACGEGRLRLLRGQVEGKKALDAAQLIAGRTVALGTRLASLS